ncbi:hypothetical protein LWI28_023460 [Acer negundo]|uniref:DUF629 domain-containing protein n=1 Tax=Acer negundo TaxID=4023 RepID=A0AAD5NWI0_ACENE|nr:hypothetical protein LWI28_023460 [Acer negundo]
MREKKLKVLFESAIDCKKEHDTWNFWECINCTDGEKFYDRTKLRDHFVENHWNLEQFFDNLEEVQEITLSGEDSDLSFEIELHSSTPFLSWIYQNQRYGDIFNSWEHMKGEILNKYNSIVSEMHSQVTSPQFTESNIQANIDYQRERARKVEETLKLDYYNFIIKPIVKLFLWGKFYNTIPLDTVLAENKEKKKKKKKKKEKSSQVSVAEAADEALATDLDEHLDSMQADPNTGVRGRMISAGIKIIDKHGKDNVSLIFPIFEDYLNKKASDEEKCNLVCEGVVMFLGALAKHLEMDDCKVHTVVEKLLDVINTPSEAVQRAVSTCLSP